MGNPALLVLSWLYTGAAVWLAVYGLNMLVLTALYYIHRKRQPAPPAAPPPDTDWPQVTVQLPLYNEQQVARRLIDAVARFDYPSDRLLIQILDDSTDSTGEVVDRCAEEWRALGRRVQVVRRTVRADFKAGALRDGLEQAEGEYIAIFDADFVPSPG